MEWNKCSRDRAVVIGGSMTGILAARALAGHFREVTVLERDGFPAVGEHRRGVPQGRHTHGLLAAGLQVFEHWFPGISAEMLAAGALGGDIVRDTRWFFEGGCHRRPASGLDGLLASRPFLEGMLRERARKLPNLRVIENAQVAGLTTTANRDRVTGVRLAEGSLEADLVIDAAGRGSRSPLWLEQIGYAKPAEERIEVSLGYTTRNFRRNPSDLNGDLAAVIPATPQGKRGGAMTAQEGNRWTVTLTGYFGLYCPPDLPGFIEFARSLPTRSIHEVVSRAEPLGEPAMTRYPASLRRRYEALNRFPEGFLVMGDAISSFNPIYGQGMSVAALQSMELDAALREGARGLAQRFFARAAKVVDVPWNTAAGNDLRMPEVPGKRGLRTLFINWYLENFHKAAQHDDQLTIAFHKVANLLAPPESLLRPGTVGRVISGRFRGGSIPSLDATPRKLAVH